jgi:hypothetical protein
MSEVTARIPGLTKSRPSRADLSFRGEWVVYRGAQDGECMINDRLIDPLTGKMIWSREQIAVRFAYSISSNDPEIQMMLITT